MHEIKYTYPIADVTDLQARLMLDGAAVSDWVTATAYAIQDIHAGYVVELDDVDADAVQWASASQELADEKALPAPVDLGDMPEKIDYIYDKFTYIPPDRPAIVVPAASDPDMVTLVVQLRDAPTMKNGLKVVASMLEPGNVYLDGAHEVDKTYEGVTGEYTDEDGVTHQGVALVEVFASTKLEEVEYNPLYRVVAPGVRRTVWVPEGGGELGKLPETKPED